MVPAGTVYSRRVKAHLPAFARFLIVLNFLEGALRITSQWDDQVWYLEQFRYFPWWISRLFLAATVVTVLASCTGILLERSTEWAVAALTGVTVLQAFGVGLLFDADHIFFIRNLSIMASLFALINEAPARPMTGRRKYLRCLLLLLLFSPFIVQGRISPGRIVVYTLGLIACLLIIAGFKSTLSAAVIVGMLSIFNVFANNWWTLPATLFTRDCVIDDFLQTFSIMGGVILLEQMLNEKPKEKDDKDEVLKRDDLGV